jgi:cytochrome P450
MTFLAARHETTASAVTWTICVLAKDPRVQAKLREEIVSAIRGKSCEVTSSTIDSLRYQQAVCNETMRLFPPVSLTVRVSVQDIVIAGQHIPKGTAITLLPGAVNASTKPWGPKAAGFIPERWLDPKKAGAIGNKFSFMTFLHSPRSGIWGRFARGELACLIVAWVRAFDSQLLEDDFVPEIRGRLTVKPLNWLLVKVRPTNESEDSSHII